MGEWPFVKRHEGATESFSGCSTTWLPCRKDEGMPYRDRDDQRRYRREWIAKRRADYLADRFCVDCGGVDHLEIDPSNLRRAVKQIAALAGLDKHVQPYDMRRTMVSILSEDDVSPERIADVAGHDLSVAMRVYRRRLRPIADAAVAPMDDFFGDVLDGLEGSTGG